MSKEIGKVLWTIRGADKPIQVRDMKKNDMLYAFLTLQNEPYNENELIKRLELVLVKPKLTRKEKEKLPSIIKGYNKLPRNQKLYAETVVEQLFTKEEAIKLESCFGKLGTLQFERQLIPWFDEFQVGITVIPTGRLNNHWRLSDEEEGLNLGFKVSAYYDLRACEFVKRNKGGSGNKKENVTSNINDGEQHEVNRQKELER